VLRGKGTGGRKSGSPRGGAGEDTASTLDVPSTATWGVLQSKKKLQKDTGGGATREKRDSLIRPHGRACVHWGSRPLERTYGGPLKEDRNGVEELTKPLVDKTRLWEGCCPSIRSDRKRGKQPQSRTQPPKRLGGGGSRTESFPNYKVGHLYTPGF